MAKRGRSTARITGALIVTLLIGLMTAEADAQRRVGGVREAGAPTDAAASTRVASARPLPAVDLCVAPKVGRQAAAAPGPGPDDTFPCESCGDGWRLCRPAEVRSAVDPDARIRQEIANSPAYWVSAAGGPPMVLHFGTPVRPPRLDCQGWTSRKESDKGAFSFVRSGAGGLSLAAGGTRSCNASLPALCCRPEPVRSSREGGDPTAEDASEAVDGARPGPDVSGQGSDHSPSKGDASATPPASTFTSPPMPAAGFVGQLAAFLAAGLVVAFAVWRWSRRRRRGKGHTVIVDLKRGPGTFVVVRAAHTRRHAVRVNTTMGSFTSTIRWRNSTGPRARVRRGR